MPESSNNITPDTEAVLLLCARFGGEKDAGLQPLTDAEYAKLALWLRGQGLRPADLVNPGGRDHVRAYGELEDARMSALLDRGGRLAFEVERWAARGLWIAGRGDRGYPSRWRARLGNSSPPLAYGVGNRELLESGGLGMVGSRDVDAAATSFTEQIARSAAESRMTVVSGGARGVDQIAMTAALAAGGCVVGVTAEGVAKMSVKSEIRNHIIDGTLVLVSAVSPSIRFTTWAAMARNRLIYTLSDYVVVVSATAEKGGTWSGAVEDLKKRWVPLFVRSAAGMPPGNELLLSKGGIALAESDCLHESGLRSILRELSSEWENAGHAQAELPFPET